MQLPVYNYTIDNNFLDYYFTSQGPKGDINKIIRFVRISPTNYNLSFGDFVAGNRQLNDFTISNNGDSKKILNTIAVVTSEFLEYYPNVHVLAKGSTDARTRLYRMAITINWKMIDKKFEILGLKNSTWQKFQAGKHYDAFLASKK